MLYWTFSILFWLEKHQTPELGSASVISLKYETYSVGITGFLDFLSSDIQENRKHNVSEAGSVSIFW
jgi:hypothetical protein